MQLPSYTTAKGRLLQNSKRKCYANNRLHGRKPVKKNKNIRKYFLSPSSSSSLPLLPLGLLLRFLLFLLLLLLFPPQPILHWLNMTFILRFPRAYARILVNFIFLNICQDSIQPTLKIMKHKRLRIIHLSRPHWPHSRTKARNRQDHHITHLLRPFHPRKYRPINPMSLPASIVILWVIKKVKYDICPYCRSCELHHIVMLDMQLPRPLQLECRFGDVGYNLSQHRMPGLALDGPLAELYSARVPVLPVGAIWVSFDADDKANLIRLECVGKPFGSWFERAGVDIRVDTSTGKKD